MQRKTDRDAGRTATALMATTFVFAGGLIACLCVSVAFADDYLVPVLTCLGTLGTAMMLLWMLRLERAQSRTDRSFLEIFRRPKEDDELLRYQPLRMKRHQPQIYGSNEPPSAESVRELADNARTWVPSDRNLKQE